MPEQNILQLALEYHSRGQLNNARTAYLQVLKNIPDQEQVLNNLGALEASLQNYQLASNYFRKITNISPNKVGGWSSLASALDLCGDFKGAQLAYLKALDLDVNNVQILLVYGNFLRRNEKLDEAQDIYRVLLTADPGNKEALNNLGNIHREIGNFENALQYFEKVVELYGGNDVIYNNIATTYSDLEDQDKALVFFNLALKHNPRHILALNGKGNALRELCRLDQAIDCFQAAIQIEPTSFISQSNLAGAIIASSKSDEEKIRQGQNSLKVYLDSQRNLSERSFPIFALKHHLEQAQYLYRNQIDVPGLERFIDVGQELMQRFPLEEGSIFVGHEIYSIMREYLGSYVEYEIPNSIRYGLNPKNEWKKIEQQYFDSDEAIYIDNFLSEEALEALYKYCLISKVWTREYPKCYLGAFGYQGFISKLHLKIANEIRELMPNIFKEYRLSHLWAFKYDAKLGSGINVHADPARVNINFWLTPDEFNLEEGRGGLIVYGKKAKAEWDFHTYNNNADKIYNYISNDVNNCTNVPYKRNRCVLFNSVLFHETDKIDFSDVYEGRRINMTYLFGNK